MSIKLDNLSDWHPLSGSIVLRASDDRARRVRVYLNCLEPTPLFVVQAGAPARFLATMPAGLETLEFVARGEVEIGADTVDRVVYYQATETEKMWFDGDGATFTTIHERAPRNEALEWVQFQAEQNQKRMEAALRAEMQTHLAAMRSEYENASSGVHGGEAPQHPKPAAGKKAAGKQPVDGGTPQPAAGAPAGAGAAADGTADGENEE
ncbi:MAG: hypothetical protein E5X86_12625 [Mesorhizobium sp.]|uniref:hypothetical protein n=1 Tax=Mesorhizobium sp. TaxID=1871066 RepID=UPI000FE66AA1|nr:hypothetical protein [Mesorhizobium sp.]RWM79348.1 MAG: hypothetical protein EOR83_29595 [Mesorhizobium sp.]TIO17256.1 MAG: hypothetical protein E5X86_12625 [Mesorhizobium sp.]